MNMALDQTRLPLQEALRRFREEAPAFFRIPAHRFDAGVDEETLRFLGADVFCADLTEAEGLDDLHDPSGVIAEAQGLAADLFGSEHCFFLVNGSTGGNEAMLLAAAGPGDSVLLVRNAHVSAVQGMILNGAEPVWLQPDMLPGWQIDGPVMPEQIEAALRKDRNIRAVFLTSPTYYGVCSPVRAIAEVCQRYGVLLLVDEAHGSHLYFSDTAPEGAVGSGADLVVQSLHKTGGSLTQSSLLHVCGGGINAGKVRECLRLVTSTSPSYVLMASLDGARHQLALQGKELVSKAESLAELCRTRLSGIRGVRVLQDSRTDPLRVVFSAADRGISGSMLQKEVYEKARVSLELADLLYAVCVISWGNTREDIERLAGAVEELVQRQGAGKTAAEGVPVWSGMPLPEICLSPRKAWYAEKEAVALEESCGRIAGESVAPYPPGVPVLQPGERIRRETAELLKFIRDRKMPLHGPADAGLKTIRVIKE